MKGQLLSVFQLTLFQHIAQNQMMLWLISLSRVSGMQQLLKEKNERFNLEVEEYSSKEQRRCQSCDFDTTLEEYKSICSVTDVLVMEETKYRMKGQLLSVFQLTLFQHIAQNHLIQIYTIKRAEFYFFS
jgi:hypothetical protein